MSFLSCSTVSVVSHHGSVNSSHSTNQRPRILGQFDPSTRLFLDAHAGTWNFTGPAGVSLPVLVFVLRCIDRNHRAVASLRQSTPALQSKWPSLTKTIIRRPRMMRRAKRGHRFRLLLHPKRSADALRLPASNAEEKRSSVTKSFLAATVRERAFQIAHMLLLISQPPRRARKQV